MPPYQGGSTRMSANNLTLQIPELCYSVFSLLILPEFYTARLVCFLWCDVIDAMPFEITGLYLSTPHRLLIESFKDRVYMKTKREEIVIKGV